LEALDELIGLIEAIDDPKGKGKGGEAELALESANGESYYRVARLGDTLHFHFALGTNKEKLSRGESLFEFACNSQGREDVATCATTREENTHN
jgi:hypothetical protein